MIVPIFLLLHVNDTTHLLQNTVYTFLPFTDCLLSPSLLAADILREFNPSLTGFSEGIGKEKTFLNQAVAGAKSGSVNFFTLSNNIT